MQPTVRIVLAALIASGCAAEQRITGPVGGRATTAALIPVRVVGRCPIGSGMGYRPFIVIDGQVYVPGDTAAVAALDPSRIATLGVLKGEAAGAQYGPVAAVAGVLVITTRPRGAGSRPATPPSLMPTAPLY